MVGRTRQSTHSIPVAAAITIVTIAMLVPACTSKSKPAAGGAKALSASIVRSGGQAPKIGNGAITPAANGNVTVAASVVTPETDAGSSDQKVTVSVWDDAAHNKLISSQSQNRKVKGGSTTRYSFTVSGPAAARLRAAGVGGAATTPDTAPADLVTVRDQDQRNLDGKGGADHVWNLSVSGAGLLGAPATHGQASTGSGSASTAVNTTQLGGAWGSFTIVDNMSDNVLLTSTPVSCMYDNGRYESDPSSLNGVQLRPVSSSNNTTLPASASTQMRQRNSGDVDNPNDPSIRVIDHLNVLYSEEVRAFLTNYADWLDSGTTQVPTYMEAINTLGLGNSRGGTPSCSKVENAIVLGIEDMTTHAHREFLLVLHEDQAAGCPSASWIDSNNACIVVSDVLGHGVGGIAFDASHLNDGPTSHTLSLVDYPYASGTTNATAPAVAPDGSCETWNWMTCVYKPGVSDDVRLMDVLWPGTHDSGTGMLSGDSAYRDVPPGSDITHTTDCSAAPITDFAEHPDDVQRWAVTQRTTPRQQLENGIRYLDFRAGWDAGVGIPTPGTPPHPAQWAVVHSSFSPSPLFQTMRSVNDWATGHPNEVALVQVGVCDTYSSDGKTAYYPHLPALENLLELTVCGQSFHNDGTNFRDRTVADVRSTKHNLVLVLANAPWDTDFLNQCAPYINTSQDFLIGFQPYDFPTGPTEFGDGEANICASSDAASTVNNSMIGMLNNTGQYGYSISTFKTNKSGATMGIAGLHYELPSSPGALIEYFGKLLFHSCPQALLDFGRGLLPGYGITPTRTDLINQLLCGSVMAVDDFGQNTVNDDPLYPQPNFASQIIGINSWSRSNKNCPYAPDDVLLHFSVDLPANSTISIQAGAGLFDPQYARAAAEAKNGLTASLSPDNKTITLKNAGTTAIKGIVSAALAFPLVPKSVSLTVTDHPSGASIGVRAGNGSAVSLNGNAPVTVPYTLPGPSS